MSPIVTANAEWLPRGGEQHGCEALLGRRKGKAARETKAITNNTKCFPPLFAYDGPMQRQWRCQHGQTCAGHERGTVLSKELRHSDSALDCDAIHPYCQDLGPDGESSRVFLALALGNVPPSQSTRAYPCLNPWPVAGCGRREEQVGQRACGWTRAAHKHPTSR